MNPRPWGFGTQLWLDSVDCKQTNRQRLITRVRGFVWSRKRRVAMTTRQLQLYERKLLDTKSRLIDQVQKEERRIQKQSAFGEASEFLNRYFVLCEDLRLVEDALERIEQQNYGNCHHCGSRIERKRLAAMPWARMCTMCQGLTDRTSRCFAR